MTNNIYHVLVVKPFEKPYILKLDHMLNNEKEIKEILGIKKLEVKSVKLRNRNVYLMGEFDSKNELDLTGYCTNKKYPIYGNFIVARTTFNWQYGVGFHLTNYLEEIIKRDFLELYEERESYMLCFTEYYPKIKRRRKKRERSIFRL